MTVHLQLLLCWFGRGAVSAKSVCKTNSVLKQLTKVCLVRYVLCDAVSLAPALHLQCHLHPTPRNPVTAARNRMDRPDAL